MRVFLRGSALFLTLTAVATFAAEAADRHVFEILGGMQWMSDDWKAGEVDLTTPVEIGIRWVSPFIEGPVGLESGYSYAWDRDEVGPVDLKSDISRLHFGVRYALPGSWLLAHVVGGLQWMDASLEADIERTGEVLTDSAIGFYAGTGASVPVSESWRVGADLRYTWTTLDFEGVDVDAGGLHLAGLVGVAW